MITPEKLESMAEKLRRVLARETPDTIRKWYKKRYVSQKKRFNNYLKKQAQ